MASMTKRSPCSHREALWSWGFESMPWSADGRCTLRARPIGDPALISVNTTSPLLVVGKWLSRLRFCHHWHWVCSGGVGSWLAKVAGERGDPLETVLPQLCNGLSINGSTTVGSRLRVVYAGHVLAARHGSPLTRSGVFGVCRRLHGGGLAGGRSPGQPWERRDRTGDGEGDSDPQGGAESVDEGGRGRVHPRPGEDGGEDGDAEHSAEFPERVVGSRGHADFFLGDGRDCLGGDGGEDQSDADAGHQQGPAELGVPQAGGCDHGYPAQPDRLHEQT